MIRLAENVKGAEEAVAELVWLRIMNIRTLNFITEFQFWLVGAMAFRTVSTCALAAMRKQNLMADINKKSVI